jgi:hypothetical protein
MKPRYDAIIYTGDKTIGNNGFVKWRAVTNLKRLERNAKTRYPETKFINVFDKKTKDKVLQITF